MLYFAQTKNWPYFVAEVSEDACQIIKGEPKFQYDGMMVSCTDYETARLSLRDHLSRKAGSYLDALARVSMAIRPEVRRIDGQAASGRDLAGSQTIVS